MAKPFSVKIKISAWGKTPPVSDEELDVLVDTGAAYTALPQKLLKKLKIPVLGTKNLRLANGHVIKREYGPCILWVVNGWVGTTVLFAESEDLPLLGMNTLDNASMEVDIFLKKLIPVQAIQASTLL